MWHVLSRFEPCEIVTWPFLTYKVAISYSSKILWKVELVRLIRWRDEGEVRVPRFRSASLGRYRRHTQGGRAVWGWDWGDRAILVVTWGTDTRVVQEEPRHEGLKHRRLRRPKAPGRGQSHECGCNSDDRRRDCPAETEEPYPDWPIFRATRFSTSTQAIQAWKPRDCIKD